jgi:hypothetical protein
MWKVMVLLCALGAERCTPDTAESVIAVPGRAGSPAHCAVLGQQYVASSPLARGRRAVVRCTAE